MNDSDKIDSILRDTGHIMETQVIMNERQQKIKMDIDYIMILGIMTVVSLSVVLVTVLSKDK